MSDPTTIEQAKYVFNSILTIREYFFHQHARCIAALSENSLLSGLSLPQTQMIHAIYNREQVTLTELARMQKVSPPSASTMVDRLVEKGVLIRKQDTRDRRKVSIRVSPGVSADFKKFQASMLSSFIEVVEKIGPETAAKWCEVLTKIKAVLAPVDSDD